MPLRCCRYVDCHGYMFPCFLCCVDGKYERGVHVSCNCLPRSTIWSNGMSNGFLQGRRTDGAESGICGNSTVSSEPFEGSNGVGLGVEMEGT
uniref:Uncharacterized protein n=1 Tax=Arundo donax TaxID=35708 RepID=A0A0A9CQG7_ARUDO